MLPYLSREVHIVFVLKNVILHAQPNSVQLDNGLFLDWSDRLVTTHSRVLFITAFSSAKWDNDAVYHSILG